HKRCKINFFKRIFFKNLNHLFQTFSVCKRLLSLYIDNNIDIHMFYSLSNTITSTVMLTDATDSFPSIFDDLIIDNLTVGDYKHIIKQTSSHSCFVGTEYNRFPREILHQLSWEPRCRITSWYH